VWYFGLGHIVSALCHSWSASGKNVISKYLQKKWGWVQRANAPKIAQNEIVFTAYMQTNKKLKPLWTTLPQPHDVQNDKLFYHSRLTINFVFLVKNYLSKKRILIILWERASMSRTEAREVFSADSLRPTDFCVNSFVGKCSLTVLQKLRHKFTIRAQFFFSISYSCSKPSSNRIHKSP